jgi:tetratricopeptide (TPR) repeat protein
MYPTLIVLAGIAISLPLCAQVKPPTTTPTSPGKTVGSPTPTNPNNNTNNFPNTNSMPVIQRPIFLSGKVVLQDGTPPPEPVKIERLCGGNPRSQGYTDMKGHFSFQLDSGMNTEPDASEDGFRMPGQTGSSASRGNSLSRPDLAGCDLRASLPGFRSSSVSLGIRQSLDNPDVGTIILTRMGNVEGTTISMTSLNAPKDSLKAFTKGRELVKKEKYDDAQREFQKAVDGYPKYASAWYQLGLLQVAKQPDEAEKSFNRSIEADPKFMNPYLDLVLLLEKRTSWEPARDWSAKAIKLNATDFPQIHFFNAVANFNLHDLPAAEKSAREGVRLDTRRQLAKCRQLLGIILAQKQDYAGAAEHLRAYVEMAPNAPDVAEIRKQLAWFEKESVASKQP